MKPRIQLGLSVALGLAAAGVLVATFFAPEEDLPPLPLTSVEVKVQKEMISEAPFAAINMIGTRSCLGCLLEVEQLDSLINSAGLTRGLLRSAHVYVLSDSLEDAVRFARVAKLRLPTTASSYKALSDSLGVAESFVKELRFMVVDLGRGQVVYEHTLPRNVSTPLRVKREILSQITEALRRRS